MSSIITPDTAGRPLVEQPFDKFWDGRPTRREIQRAFNKIATNEAEMMGMCDTAALVVNFLCERLRVTREELDEYVQKKSKEVLAMREAMKTEEEKQKAQEAQ